MLDNLSPACFLPAPGESDSEIGHLVTTLNRMTMRLHKAFEAQQPLRRGPAAFRRRRLSRAANPAHGPARRDGARAGAPAPKRRILSLPLAAPSKRSSR